MVRLGDVSPREPVLCLPHPYLTPYFVTRADKTTSAGQPLYNITSDSSATKVFHEKLDGTDIFFTEPEDPKSGERPHESNNTPWGRARRSPSFIIHLSEGGSPTLGQAWLVAYIICTLRPAEEFFRLQMSGPGAELLTTQLKAVCLAIPHPPYSAAPGADQSVPPPPPPSSELLVLRSAFWQGAGSPFGARPAWVPDEPLPGNTKPASAYPPPPLEHTLTNIPDTALCWHPRRSAKPRPGSVIYSRWIPHLRENFSMVALDWQNEEHLGLFHKWQNDPRVSQGWNEEGSLEYHREYLRKIDEDPHQITVLARFDGVCFGYFEIYWAKEDRLGAYYDAHDFDRGRHMLVGDVRYRGPHRASAWWSSVNHYMFLDEPRTMAVVGEPKYTNTTVLSYDFIHGFGIDKFVDLPHKRSGMMRCGRERFFQLCPLAENDKVVGGTLLGLLPKL